MFYLYDPFFFWTPTLPLPPTGISDYLDRLILN